MSDSPRVAAARSGSKTYKGKPCKTCGHTDKYVISCGCVKCTAERAMAANKAVRDLMRGA